jgi:predicted PolB exonuclease-like 3'-5' exonuclease
MRTIIFDIETGPLPDERLFSIMPAFEPPPRPGRFEPTDVKTGNLKDPGKIKEKIEAARFAHEEAVAQHEETVAAAELEHRAKIRDRAALDAATGQVLAIGMLSDSGEELLYHVGAEGEEAKVIERFWAMSCPAKIVERGRMVGFNSNRFDLPFLVRRSWLLGVPVPDGLRSGRYFDPRFIDLMDEWKLGDHGCSISMDRLCKALGLEGKNGDGALFYQTYAEDRLAALDYLANDLRMTMDVARALGVLREPEGARPSKARDGVVYYAQDNAAPDPAPAAKGRTFAPPKSDKLPPKAAAIPGDY